MPPVPQTPSSLSALARLASPPDTPDSPPGDLPPWMADLAASGGSSGAPITPPADPDMNQWLSDLRVSKLKTQGWSPADILAADRGAATLNAQDAADRAPGAGVSGLPFAQELQREDLASRAGQSGLDLASTLAPGSNDLSDYNARRNALRQFQPDVYNWWQEQNKAALDRAVAPINAEMAGSLAKQQLANEGEIGKANVTGAARFNRPPSEQARDFIASIAELSRSGGFGVDKQGRPMAPPPDVMARVNQEIQNVQGGGATGAASTGYLTTKDLNDYVTAHPGSTLDDARRAAVLQGYTVRDQ